MESAQVTRPWGWYRTVFESIDVKVKILRVNPGQRLSLQRHKFRAEHWRAIEGSGIAEVEFDGYLKFVALAVGESVNIAVGAKHRLSGGKAGLTIIEVQTGSSFSEDDIERFEDDFGRV